jgi:DNA polymerase III subunit gamma/tau
MSYLVLARKYRPRTFEELIGQEHVTVTLANALAAGRPAHAYIFSGPRGCGKTTTARILAKALNCAQGPTAKPCGECPPCRDAASGASSGDVLEIDGASNRGIDQIRELRETVKYAPSQSRHRIIIIDEAHQITDAGFNALLKTLEEPPPHAVFMMATTEMQKIPGTILSRCQRFQLRPIRPAAIREKLEDIVKKEGLKADPEALAEAARAAHGSLRDALSLLDQLIAYSPGDISGENVRALLGVLPRRALEEFAAALKEGEPAAVMKAVQKASEDGHDLFQLAQDLKDFWHRALLWKSGVQDGRQPDADALKKAADAHGFAELERNLRLISRGLTDMRRSESSRVTFELTCLELAQKPVDVDALLDRLERLEKNLGGGSATPAAATRGEPAPARSSARESAAPSGARAEPPPAQSSASAAPEPSPASEPGDLSAAWTRLLQEVMKRKPSLGSFLAAARWEAKDGALRIVSREDFASKQITANLALITDILRERPGVEGLFVRSVFEPGPAAPPPEEPLPSEPSAEASSEEEGPAPAPEESEKEIERPREIEASLQKVMKRFPGKLKKIDSPAR